MKKKSILTMGVLFANLLTPAPSAIAQNQGASNRPCKCWIDIKTLKRAPSVPISATGQGLEGNLAQLSSDEKTAYNPITKQNFALENGCWIDIKTLKPAPSVPISATGQGIAANVAELSSDGQTAYNPITKQNFALEPCPPPGTVKPPTPTPEVSSVPEETSSGEDYAKGLEFFGGYQYQRAPDEPVKHLHGLNTSIFYNVTPHVSVGGDFSFLFGSTSETVGATTFDTSLHRQTYLFGPQFNFYPDDKVKIFVHPLFGVVHDSIQTTIGTTTTDFSANAFAMAFGGGVDVRVSPRVSIRAFQADYLGTRFGGEFQNNFRLSTGLVLRLGGH